MSEIRDLTGLDRYPKVLLIDTDAQCNLSISCLEADSYEDLAYNKKICTIKDLFVKFLDNEEPNINVDDCILKGKVRSSENRVYKYIDLIPSHQELIHTDMNIAVYNKPDFRGSLIGTSIYKFQILDRILKEVKNNYDFIFIDCPPNLNFITQNALYSSNYYLIPTLPDKLSSYGILSITNKVDELNKLFGVAVPGYKTTKLIGIVANNVREYGGGPKTTHANTLARLRSIFINLVFSEYLTHGDGITTASEHGYPVFAYEMSSTNASKQSNLLKSILREFLGKL